MCLSGENEILDQKALEYLPWYVELKKAVKAYILVSCRLKGKKIYGYDYAFPFEVANITVGTMKKIYDYYCFAFNLDNIVFTFFRDCHDNMIYRLLRETDINEKEIVCLGIYNFRQIPEKIEDA